jgi:hypothetical protein
MTLWRDDGAEQEGRIGVNAIHSVASADSSTPTSAITWPAGRRSSNLLTARTTIGRTARNMIAM